MQQKLIESTIWVRAASLAMLAVGALVAPGRANAKVPGAVRLDYLITQTDPAPYFDNVDKWYIRDAGAIYGKYTLYKLRPR